MITDRYKRIYAVVRRIPRGRVATYGQVAELAGLDGHARQVGYALHALRLNNVPWHRVVNAFGGISPRSGSDSHELQRALLEAEGVKIDLRGRIELKVFRWKTSSRRVVKPSRSAGGVESRHGKRGP